MRAFDGVGWGWGGRWSGDQGLPALHRRRVADRGCRARRCASRRRRRPGRGARPDPRRGGVPGDFPPEARRRPGRRRARAGRGPSGRDRHRPRPRHDRPAGVAGPRPGRADRAARRGLPRAVRHRRRRGLRRPRRPARRGGARAGPDALHARPAVPAAPRPIGEGAASLLPGDRPALLWTIDLDGSGRRGGGARARGRAQPRGARLRRGPGAIDAGPRRRARALRDLGRLRLAREAERGGVSLTFRSRRSCGTATATPALRDPAAGRALERPGLAARGHLRGADHGATAASGSSGPRARPRPRALEGLRHSARALGVRWPDGASYQDVVRGLDPARPGRRRLRRAGGAPVRRRRLRGLGRAPRGTPRRPTRRSPPPTPTSRPPCAGWPTGWPTRSCSPSAGGAARRRGRSRPCRSCRTIMRETGRARGPPSAPASTTWRP